MAQTFDHSWDIIAYEVRMFHATYETVLDPSELNKLPKVMANAIEESAVLHTRILCDVFLNKGMDPDDIQLSTLFPAWYTNSKYQKIKWLAGNLRKTYGSAQKRGSPCWVFNKMMAHPTAHRGKSYDYTIILENLEPLIQNIITEIELLRGVRFTWSW